MCFGEQEQGKQTTTYQTNPGVASAADQSLSFAQNLQNQGYQAYGGPRVADFSNLQQSGFGVAANAVDQNNPYYQTSADYINNYATGASPVVGPNTISSQMSPYMNQYVSMALAPQIQAQNAQFAQQNKNLDATATMSGAFGDARAGVEAANLSQNQDIARTGLVGQAYTNAFNTAIGAGAQDVGNSMPRCSKLALGASLPVHRRSKGSMAQTLPMRPTGMVFRHRPAAHSNSRNRPGSMCHTAITLPLSNIRSSPSRC